MSRRLAASVVAWAVLSGAVADAVLRQITRRPLLDWLGLEAAGSPAFTAVLAVVAAGALAGLRPRVRHAVVFAALFTLGSVVQTSLGARLQSDGFYYYAYARSIWFDRDVDLANDYRLLGLDDARHRHLFTPTVTGHAQTTWAIGPALLWSPFLAVGHGAAHALRVGGADVAVDGTSFPYRQAVCLAGLFYGLAGLFVCFGLARRLAGPGLALMAVVAVAGGSFVLWYLVREPTMSHSVSMAAVAAVVSAWLRVSQSRSPRAWLLFGLAGGLMMAVRWQNALVLLLPAATLLRAFATAPAARDRRRVVLCAAVSAGAIVVGFLPQMLAWQAIYGRLLATSPIGPVMYWTSPVIVDLLWSSRTGLFATSPALYLAAIGLVPLWRLDRRLSAAGLLLFGLMIWTNGAVDDWYGGAGYGARRFDSVVPFFVCGMAALAVTVTRVAGRHPGATAGIGLALLVLWNVTLTGAARGGAYRIGQPVSFGDLAAAQARVLHDWIGHPPSYPASLAFAVANGVHPSRFDLLRPNRFLGDPARPYGRIDVGAADRVYLETGEAWHAPEREGGLDYRWARDTAGLLLPLHHSAPLLLQIAVRPYEAPGLPPQQLTIAVNGRALPTVVLSGGWQRVELPTPAAWWRAGVNRVSLQFTRETRPVEHGGRDARPLAGAIDYVRVAVIDPGRP